MLLRARRLAFYPRASDGGAVLVIVGLFVEPWKALVLLVFVLVYQ
jgi:hypothetical protein